jgi:hypothetical protein
MLRFSLIHHRKTTKACSVFMPLSSVYRSNRPVTGPYRAVYRSEPNELAFQFGIWIWSVFSGNRSLPTGLPKPTAGGLGDRFGKLNPAPTLVLFFLLPGEVEIVGQRTAFTYSSATVSPRSPLVLFSTPPPLADRHSAAVQRRLLPVQTAIPPSRTPGAG